MNELAARIADGWAPPLSDAERAAMETDLHVTSCREPAGECVQCMATWRTVRRIVAAATPRIVAARDRELAEAGRLLPEGTVVPEEEINGG